jgi:Family of unknown function (DUF5938)/Saccharopine dehydrogenase NADP binding domain
MSDKKPVVVYGASGYTGRLVCEYLRELHLPFIAAGRDAKRTQAVMDKIPGIENADYEVVEVEHNVDALTKLFRGAKVVSNMVGPFSKYGSQTVEACLAAGCHYTDTTGEQDWVLDAKTRYGAEFAKKGLLLSPGIAQMYTTGEIAANICLENPGLDTLDILVLWKGFPTYASTQTIFAILQAKWYYLEHNKFVEWPQNAHFDVNVPGQHQHALVTPWAGTSHPIWFKDDPRVASCKALGGVFAREVMEGFVATQKNVRGADQAAAAGRPAGGARQYRRLDPGRHAAARESARQYLARLGLCVGAARARPLRDPWRQQLQADRSLAGPCRILPAADAAEEGWLRLGVPGVRTSRIARRAEELRACHGANRHRASVTG